MIIVKNPKQSFSSSLLALYTFELHAPLLSIGTIRIFSWYWFCFRGYKKYNVRIRFGVTNLFIVFELTNYCDCMSNFFLRIFPSLYCNLIGIAQQSRMFSRWVLSYRRCAVLAECRAQKPTTSFHSTTRLLHQLEASLIRQRVIVFERYLTSAFIFRLCAHLWERRISVNLPLYKKAEFKFSRLSAREIAKLCHSICWG